MDVQETERVTVNCRCTKEKCKLRVTLRKHPDAYVREPKCKACGSRLRVDAYRMSGKGRKTCWCDGYHFPHQESSYYCIHNPEYLEHEEERYA